MGTTSNSSVASAIKASRQVIDTLVSAKASAGRSQNSLKSVVDLVIAIGTDSPMLSVARSLDKALNSSVDAAVRASPTSLRVTCLGVGGCFGTTCFKTSVSDYLSSDVRDTTDLQEEAAPSGSLTRAVIDLSRYFDWLPDANRSIFLVGDIGLETTFNDIDKTNDAVSAANAANVKVYTCASLPRAGVSVASRPDGAFALTGKDIAEYMRLARQTAAIGYVSIDGATDFPWMLREIICDNAPSIPSDRGSGRDVGTPSYRRVYNEQERLIIRTATMLAAVLHRVTDTPYLSNEESKHASNVGNVRR